MNLPANFEVLPDELKFQTFDQLELDATSLTELGDSSPMLQDLVLPYVEYLVANDMLVYRTSKNPVRGGTFPGEDWIEPFDFDTDPASTLAVWKRGYIERV